MSWQLFAITMFRASCKCSGLSNSSSLQAVNVTSSIRFYFNKNSKFPHRKWFLSCNTLVLFFCHSWSWQKTWKYVCMAYWHERCECHVQVAVLRVHRVTATLFVALIVSLWHAIVEKIQKEARVEVSIQPIQLRYGFFFTSICNHSELSCRSPV